jgi:hypothetical protein
MLYRKPELQKNWLLPVGFGRKWLIIRETLESEFDYETQNKAIERSDTASSETLQRDIRKFDRPGRFN